MHFFRGRPARPAPPRAFAKTLWIPSPRRALRALNKAKARTRAPRPRSQPPSLPRAAATTTRLRVPAEVGRLRAAIWRRLPLSAEEEAPPLLSRALEASIACRRRGRWLPTGCCCVPAMRERGPVSSEGRTLFHQAMALRSSGASHQLVPARCARRWLLAIWGDE